MVAAMTSSYPGQNVIEQLHHGCLEYLAKAISGLIEQIIPEYTEGP